MKRSLSILASAVLAASMAVTVASPASAATTSGRWGCGFDENVKITGSANSWVSVTVGGTTKSASYPGRYVSASVKKGSGPYEWSVSGGSYPSVSRYCTPD